MKFWKKFGLTLGLVLGCAFGASAQGYHYENIVLNQQGNPVVNASVTICTAVATGTPCSPQVTIYSDIGLSIVKTQPIKTGPLGNYDFYIAPTTLGYKVTITGSRINPVSDLLTIPCTAGSSCGGGGGGGGNYQTVQENGLTLAAEGTLQFLDGTNTTVVCVDNPGNLSTDCHVDAAAGAGADLGADNTFTNNNRFKGPIPWRDATAYGAVSSTQTFTATAMASSPNVTLNTAGDWVNGQAISILGAGPTSTAVVPNFTAFATSAIARSSNVVTATISSTTNFGGLFVQVSGFTGGHTAFNGVFGPVTVLNGTQLQWPQTATNDSTSGGSLTPGVALYEGTNPGATSYAYTACAVGAGGGCSAKSLALTVTNGPATLTELDYVWLYFSTWSVNGLPTGTDYLCVYRNSTFVGKTYYPGYKDDGKIWDRPSNCPSSPPSVATADILTTTVLSGAGTTSLVLAANASTAGSGLFTFHDSAAAINAAAVDAKADYTASGGSEPNVILPQGIYRVSRLVIGNYRLDATGVIQNVTHPIIVNYNGTFQGHGGQDTVGLIYNTDDQTRINPVFGMDGFLLTAGGGHNTIRGVGILGTDAHFIVIGANASNAANGITIENTQCNATGGGDCLFAEGNSIFVKVKDFRCQASAIESGDPTNRQCIYFTDTYTATGWVDWDFDHIFLNKGAFHIDNPLPTNLLGGGPQAFVANTFHVVETETLHQNGMFTIDVGCTNSPVNNGILMTGNEYYDFKVADQAAFKGFLYFPRQGTTGCTRATIVGTKQILSNVTFADPWIGGDAPLSTADAFENTTGIDTNNISADQGTVSGATRFGPIRALIGQQLLFDLTNQGVGDVPAAAYLIPPPPTFVSSDGGAGGSCGAGVTEYFKLSLGDGNGWSKPSQEINASTGAGSEIITLTYGTTFATGLIGQKYRIWQGTASGSETNYYETTNQGTFNFTCGAPTGTGTPPAYGTAYFFKIPSQSGVVGSNPGWYGLASTDLFGIGKTNPVYSLDVAGLINTDKGLLLSEGSAQSGISSKSVLYSKSSTHWLYMKNASNADSGEVTIPGITGAITGGHCAEFVDAFTIQDNGSACGSGGTGTVTSVSMNAITTATQNLATCSTATSTTTPAITCTLANAPARTVFGNTSGSSGAPDFVLLTAAMEPSTTVNSVVNDTNVTGSISAQAFTLGWTGALAAARGGTGQSSYTKGDTLCPSASTTMTKLAVGSNGKVLTANSAATCGIDWETSATGVTLDTNSGANTSQVLLNFIDTPLIGFTNPSGGVESATILNTAGNGNSTMECTLTGVAQGDQLMFNGASTCVNGTPGVTPNPQVGTTYTVLTGDRGKYLTFSNASAVAVTLPQAGSAGFGSNFFYAIRNIGAGAVTITPTTSTINGNATLVLLKGMQASVFSDNTNYFATVSGQATGVTGSISGNITGEACDSGTVTINGAATGMIVSATPTTYPGDGVYWLGYVSSANTITVKVCADITTTVTASTYNVSVTPAFQ